MKYIQILVITFFVIFSSKSYAQDFEKEELDKLKKTTVITPKPSSKESSLEDTLVFSFHRREIYVNPSIGFYRGTNPFGLGLEYALTNYFGLGAGLGYSSGFSKSVYSGQVTEGSKIISPSVGLNLHLGQAFKSRMIDIVPGIAYIFGNSESNAFVGGIEMRMFLGPHVGINFGKSFGLTENTEGIFAVGLVFK
jgi:long-subunit fatty acid transport protein